MTRLRRFIAVSLCLLILLGTVSAAKVPPAPPDRQAAQILQAADVKGGLIVHIGCADGKLTAALCANESFLVHGLDANQANIAQARKHICSLGLYGKVSVEHWTGNRLPYADNMVNLIVSDDIGDVPKREAMRVLAPRGVLYAGVDGKWTRTVKPWPEQMDEWTHWLYDASNNAVIHDSVIGPPRRLQWAAGPSWQRHHDTVPGTTAMVAAKGRLFYTTDEAPACLDVTLPDKWFLVARDAFNGALLWKRPLDEWGWNQWSTEWEGRFNEPPHLPKRMVAAGDRLYATLNFNAPLTALDGATGNILRTYEGTANTDEILYRDGLLILSLNEEARKPGAGAGPVKKSVCVVDADSGKMLWKKGSYSGLRGKFNSADPFGRLELTSGGDGVFLVDHDAIISMDLKSGTQRWRIPRPDMREHLIMYGVRMSDMSVLVYADGVVLFAQPQMTMNRSWHTLPGTLYAYRAADGELLWKHQYGGWAHNWQPDVFVVDGLVWVHEHVLAPMKGHNVIDKTDVEYAVIGLDLKSGELKKRISTKEAFDVGHHHRCYRGKATERYLLPSRRGVEFVDLATGENYLHHWARGACLHGIVPSNGLIYLTPHPCDCYIQTQLTGYCALAPRSSGASSVDPKDVKRFEQGPALGKIENRKSKTENSNDWPTFRGDPLRSGSTPAAVGPKVGIAWRAAVGGRLSPVVVAGGKVYAASIDEHRVAALDAATGKTVWEFTAGGRIDTPPTIYKGLAMFGSADGWVYCVDAATGQLAWRRLIGPSRRLMGAFDQIESAWPVHGSILVQDDVAYVAAGRSTYLDDGIHLMTLEPATGRVLSEKVLYSPDRETDKMPTGDAKVIPGTLADVLVSDGSSVYMRAEKVFAGSSQGKSHLVATDGLRSADWFNRTHWTVGPARGQLLVFADDIACCIQAYPGTSRWGFFRPGDKGYLLQAVNLKDDTPKKGKTTNPKPLWAVRVPVRATAMVLAGRNLFLAGTPDVVDAADPAAAFEGRKGAKLWAVSTADGKKLAEYDLEEVPILDGLAAAGGRLYMATTDGHILCFDEDK